MALPAPASALIIFDPARAVEEARTRKVVVKGMIDMQVLRPGVDFGSVPGTDKPTLLKPGAERLCSAFGLDPRFETITAIERWDGEEPLFFYRIRCSLVHIETGREIATGIGSCNSREGRYRWRWADADKVPGHLDLKGLEQRDGVLSEFAFAVEKKETGGKYGKPASYWQTFEDAINDGTARRVQRKTSSGKLLDAWEIGAKQYRIPNDDIFSLVNTIDKMACKRALIAATLIGANASEFFTQDVEDMPGFGLDDSSPLRADIVVDATSVEVITTSASPKSNDSPWGEGEAKAFVAHWRAQGLSDGDMLAALNVTRFSEWTQGRAKADKAVEAYIAAQMGDQPASPKGNGTSTSGGR
jgi:hypothetical protein